MLENQKKNQQIKFTGILTFYRDLSSYAFLFTMRPNSSWKPGVLELQYTIRGTTLSFKEELSSFISHYTHTHHPEAHHLDSKLIISMLPHQIVLSLYRPTPQPFCSSRSTLGTAGITSNRLCTHCQLSQQMRIWIGSHKLGTQNLISWRAHSRRKIWVKFREFKSRIQH